MANYNAFKAVVHRDLEDEIIEMVKEWKQNWEECGGVHVYREWFVDFWPIHIYGTAGNFSIVEIDVPPDWYNSFVENFKERFLHIDVYQKK